MKQLILAVFSTAVFPIFGCDDPVNNMLIDGATTTDVDTSSEDEDDDLIIENVFSLSDAGRNYVQVQVFYVEPASQPNPPTDEDVLGHMDRSQTRNAGSRHRGWVARTRLVKPKLPKHLSRLT